MKKVFALLCAVLVILSSFAVAFAIEIPNAEYYRTVDMAGLFTQEEIDYLEGEILDSIERYGRDLIILTSNSDDGKGWMAYADDFFDSYGYGIGDSKDGIVLFICMEDGNRGFWTSTSGDCVALFTEANQNYIDDRLYESLVEGEFFNGVCDYIANVNYLYSNGDFSEIDSYYYDSGQYEVEYDPYLDVTEYSTQTYRPNYWTVFLNVLPGGIMFGVIIAIVYAKSLLGSMKTVRFAKTAGNYMTKRTLTSSRDIFLGTVITRTKLPDNDNSSGGGLHGTHSSFSGGHISSGGGFHGGGGRSF